MRISAFTRVYLRPAATLALAPMLLRSMPAAAQSPEQRSSLERYRDSLAVSSDSTGLRRLEHALADTGPDAAARAVADLRRGLVRLRMGEQVDGRSFGRAAKAFEDAAELEPTWPWPWYGRGLAKTGQGHWLAAEPLNLGTRVGFGSLHAAAESYARAIDLEPGFLPPLVQLTATALELRDTALLSSVVLPASRRSTAAMPALPEALYARGLAERAAGDPDSAVAAFRAYLAAGGNPGVGRLELARSLFVKGLLDGVLPYYEGAAFDDSATVLAYRSDLALIEGDSALAGFDTARGAERVAYLRRFWGERDRLELRPEGDRLREHYRRIEFARRAYPLITNRRSYSWSDAFRSGSREFDDRGIIYVRQGEPDERVLTPMFGIMPNETWLYRRPDGDLLFHFRAGGTEDARWVEGGDIQDYRLVPSIYAFTNKWVDTGELLNSRCRLWVVYCQMNGWGPEGQARAREKEQRAVAASIAVGVSSDAYGLRYPKRLAARSAIAMVGTADGLSLAHIAFAIPVEPPPATAESLLVRLPVRLRFVAWDDSGHPVASFDSSLVVALPSPIGTQPTARGRFALALPPGHWSYRMALEVDSLTGMVGSRDTLTVRRFETGHLDLSDLVLGTRARSVSWIPEPGDTARLQVEPEYRRDESLDLYYEVYGLDPDEEFRTELTLRRQRRAALTLGYIERASGPRMGSNRSISLASVKPGDYVVEVMVKRKNGETVQASRRLKIVKQEGTRGEN